MTDLAEAIAAAEAANNVEMVHELRALQERMAQIEVKTGTHDGRAWTSTTPPEDPDTAYPKAATYRWRQTAGVAVEFGDRGDMILVDVWSGASFRLASVLADDGSTSFCDALRRLIDAADDASWFKGRAQTGRAGVVRD